MSSIGSIVIGAEASALEVKIAAVVADRMEERLGTPVSIVDESHQVSGDILLVLGTPSSSNLVRSAIQQGRVELPASLGDEGFEVDVRRDGPAIVAAREPGGIVYGAGELLRQARFSQGKVELLIGHIASAPEMPLRPIYFATHFGNWYCHASTDEIRSYIEDLALCGYNALVTWFDFHHYRDLADGAEHWDRLVELDRAAKEIGMKTGRIAIANESFAGQAAPEFRAVGRLEGTGYETDLCPSKAEARKIILEDRRTFLERIASTTTLNWLCLWPYDQGGCNCDQCAPWPATYMDLCKEITEMTADVLPGTETMVSAWWIGAHRPGEDEAFFDRLQRRERWFRTIVAGTAETRRWLSLGREIPEEYGILLFPEISMFDALPWGSRGANPAPRKFAGEMAELDSYLSGAMPYSEGRYEDVNKVVWAQLLWNTGRDVLEVLRDYCRYYFGPDTAEDGARLFLDLEEGLKDLPSAASRYEAALRLEHRIEEWGRRGWRWQTIGSRAAIDALKWELDSPDTPKPRRTEAEAELRSVYEHLQHDIYLHDGDRSLRNWIWLPFDVWVQLPFNELVLPTGSA